MGCELRSRAWRQRPGCLREPPAKPSSLCLLGQWQRVVGMGFLDAHRRWRSCRKEKERECGLLVSGRASAHAALGPGTGEQGRDAALKAGDRAAREK